MNLKQQISVLIKEVFDVKRIACRLNEAAASFNGVAATIPENAPAPAKYFKGQRVLLGNVRYDKENDCVTAVFTIPYGGSKGRHWWGQKVECRITEEWFN